MWNGDFLATDQDKQMSWQRWEMKDVFKDKQVVCDADLVVLDCVAKNPGSVHDARILRESPLFASMEASPLGIILGDSAYPLRNWLMTPFSNPQGQQQETYNLRHAQTRQVIERCFGVVKRRFRCLHDELRIQPPGYTCQVIMACFMLHNMAVRLNLPTPEDLNDGPPPTADDDDANEAVPATAHERARTIAGKNKRAQLVQNYF
ncbi:protein ALP1-like [Elysia marginata]|uniref:Protein ALP1-like n=1 Tax=Elysia marginata TaxID=1093978 RepID=A0AAV4EDT0_9GAST|nr:protein ALP1-like [Elysia marginata]